MPVRRVQVDIAVIGGGIVGLWTLARLKALGYSCVLLEPASLGAGQTLASQGIIHGGIKYALTGSASKASRAIAEMPGIWHACLASEGIVDLGAATMLSEFQYLWTSGGIGSRLMGLAASRVLRTGVERVEKDQRPPAFAAAGKGIDLYRVDEPVLDVRTVLQALLDQAGGPGHTLACGIDGEGNGPVVRAAGHAIDRITGFWADDVRSAAGEIELRASRYVLTAGSGNETILRRCGIGVEKPNFWGARMQKRPLHMVMLRETETSGREIPELFGHCVGMSDKPRITITSARDSSRRRVWYIGGQLAEDGVARERSEQIEAAKAEVKSCLPWVNLDRGGLVWSTFRVDRAEGLTEDGSRPDEPVVVKVENMLVAWPTKLAFAPATAEWIKKLLQEDKILPGASGVDDSAALQSLDGLPRPPMGDAPWNDTSGRVIWTP